MKTLKITTHWTTEEADGIYRLLDDLQCAIWESYGQDIEQLYPWIEHDLERSGLYIYRLWCIFNYGIIGQLKRFFYQNMWESNHETPYPDECFPF